MNKRLTLAVMALITMPLAMMAQLNVKVQLKADNANDMHVFFYPIDAESDENAQMQKDGDGWYVQTVNQSGVGIYKIVCVTGTSQYSLPLFVNKDMKDAKLSVDLTGECPNAQMIAAGKSKKEKQAAQEVNVSMDALNSLNALYYKQSREVWTTAASMSADDLRNMVKNYTDKSSAISSDARIDDKVKEYANIFAYLMSAESGSVFNRMNSAKCKVFAEGADAGEALLPAPHTILDSPMYLLIENAAHTATQAIPKGGLDERLQFVMNNYKTAALRESMQGTLLNAFIRNYNYAKGYQEGLTLLTNLKDKYHFDETYVNRFRERASAVPGAKFPDVALIDAEGKQVSLEQFKGKYVYIDLWASWCVPCVKEVPHLQKLEAELANKDVVFVSISTDSGEDPWRKKMEQLKMHGNQWLNTDGKLCDKLNVSGIPHFLIYDKEGQLHTYNAPRPSTGSALKSILEGLK